MNPECQLDKLVAPNSPAATDLAALRSSTICDHCGAVFARQRATARFCSTACRVAAGRQLKKSA
jgi:hypothetical protein